MVHITCLAHAIHRIAKEIRGKFPRVDKLISSVEQSFLKAPCHTIVFRTEAPGITLSPEPILMRWGTWICAVLYYCTYFKDIHDVLQQLNSSAAVSIKKAKIPPNYGFLPSTIIQLESRNVLLIDSITLIKSVQNKLDTVTGEVGVAINKKLSNVLQRKCRI